MTGLSSHAVHDRASREAKARKIQFLLQRHSEGCFKRVLDVGTGAGFIAHCLHEIGWGTAGFYAVDVTDERQVADGFEFQLVADTVLPFPAGHFDLILSNHVVEHVGSTVDQEQHIGEMYRCLEAHGILYFAFPNRWRIIEPHYGIPLLSCFGSRAASTFVRLLRRGTSYDCNPLSKPEAMRLLTRAGFEVNDVTLDAIRILGKVEGGVSKKLIGSFPNFVWRPFTRFMPAFIFVCRKAVE